MESDSDVRLLTLLMDDGTAEMENVLSRMAKIVESTEFRISKIKVEDDFQSVKPRYKFDKEDLNSALIWLFKSS